MTERLGAWLMMTVLAVFPGVVNAQDGVAQPAESAEDASQDDDSSSSGDSLPPSYEAPPEYESEVTAPRVLREEEPIGDYHQPRWTARRRWPTTRVYVRPEGNVAFEWWLDTKLSLDEPEDDVRYRSQYELEFGLGHRLQLDLYLVTEQNTHSGDFELAREKVELRWAWADWDVIAGNPTLYLEYIRQDGFPPWRSSCSSAGK